MKQPETSRAVLWCNRCDRPTRHVFLEYRENRIGSFDLSFICQVKDDRGQDCRQVRTWGNEANYTAQYGRFMKMADREDGDA